MIIVVVSVASETILLGLAPETIHVEAGIVVIGTIVAVVIVVVIVVIVVIVIVVDVISVVVIVTATLLICHFHPHTLGHLRQGTHGVCSNRISRIHVHKWSGNAYTLAAEIKGEKKREERREERRSGSNILANNIKSPPAPHQYYNY